MIRVNYDQLDSLAPLAQRGDEQATNELMTEAYNLVRWIILARGWFVPRRFGEREDLVQVGMIGFLEAVQDWRPGPGSEKFSRFARRCVERELIMALKHSTRIKHSFLNYAVSLDAMAYSDSDTGPDLDRWSRWRLPDLSQVGDDPADLVATAEKSPLQARLCVNLSWLESEVLQLCLLQQQPYSVAAATLRTTTKSIDNAMQRVRRKAAKAAAELVADEQIEPEIRAVLQRISDRAA